MLDDSKKEGEQERDLFTKHKCYCDDNSAEKTKSVATLTKQIGLLESSIQELQGSSAKLSSEVAGLQADMDANAQARTTADALRKSANTDFTAEEADLVAAIGQLGQAVDVLAAIGSDQTLEAAADHATYMANYSASGSLLKLQASVKQALLAASTFLTPAQQSQAEALLQAPFTGTYTAQSGEVFGILKQMRETFESNLEAARSAEAAAVKAHTAFMGTKLDEFNTMKTSYDGKQSTLGSNDNSLSGEKTSLAQAIQQKADDEDFLAKLGTMCAEKEADYDARVALRVNEDAAIAEAIAILNNDVAFRTFGKVKATSTGATGFLLQLSSDRRHERSHRLDAATEATRREAALLLQQASSSRGSARLQRIAGMLRTGNPFETVLSEIDKMKQVMVQEAQVDKEQFDWCAGEQKTNNDNLAAKTAQLQQLGTDISALEQSIDDPQQGFKALIQQTEDSLVQNGKSQADETETRRAENVQYQKSVRDAVHAAELLDKAITALERYYSRMSGGFLQTEQAPPTTWQGNYTGQSTQGQKVISMLKFVLQETGKEESSLHAAEHQAQVSYEDSMQQLKTQEKDLQSELAKNKKALADAVEDLAGKRNELDKTTREKVSIERYLEQIKPGCDFITNNFQTRESNRALETAALDKAVGLLKASPALAAATAAAKLEAQGACQAACKADEANADCKACLAGVSVPGYCAGHPGTAGC